MFRPCNACQSQDIFLRFDLESRQIMECAGCGLRFLDPLPTKNDLAALYNDEKYTETNYFSRSRDSISNHEEQQLLAAERIRKECGSAARILEIGPGSGFFLRACLQKGLHPEGVEFSATFSDQLASASGCRIYHGDVMTLNLPENAFSAIAAFDVFEHVTDPMEWLRRIHQLLMPDGLLFLSTVSYRNLLDRIGNAFYRVGLKAPARMLYPPYHLYYFLPELLRRYAAGSGFEVVDLRQENYAPQKATANPIMRLALRSIYTYHNLCKEKTNLYMTARKT